MILSCALLGRCFEDSGDWQPDCIGVVYVRFDGAVVYYDFGNNKSSVVVKQDWIDNETGSEKFGTSNAKGIGTTWLRAG